ncbi:nitrite reductase [Desulfoscipio sp. XC116]|uniref:nitrite reductase n=1 Tax=Desulfoscipio sp. XC116 TaxID=3144975 RepID=UPI00325ABC2C
MNKAIFKQSNGMYAVNIVAACGVFTPEQFAGLGQAALECGVFRLKLTTRQTVVAVLNEEYLAKLEARLSALGLSVSPYGGTVRAVKACAGNAALCQRALGNALDLGIAMQEKFLGRELNKDVKIAVAGCSRGCTDPLCADYGLIARGQDSFDVYIGGRGGTRKPLHGQLLAEDLTGDEVCKLFEYVIDTYSKLAQPKERLASTVARVGVGEFIPPQGMFASKQKQSDNEFLAFISGKEEA